MDDTLQKSPATAWFLLPEPILFGFVKVELQQTKQRQSNDRKHNGESAKRPSPIRVIESFRCFRTSECRDNVGRGCECVGKTTIAKGGRIRSDDIDTENHASEANTVEYLQVVSAPLQAYNPILLTCDAQYSATLLQVAESTSPRVANDAMTRKPTERSHRFKIFATGM